MKDTNINNLKKEFKNKDLYKSFLESKDWLENLENVFESFSELYWKVNNYE